VLTHLAATPGLRRRGDLALPAGGTLYACAVAGAVVAGHAGAGAGAQRGVVQAGVGVVIVAGVVSAGMVQGAAAGFWRMLRVGLALLVGAYAAGALHSFAVAGPWRPVGLALLLAAYPFLFAALSRRAIREQGFEGGLATLMDVAILVSSLMVASVPALVVPLAMQHGTLSIGSAATWASDVGLLAGGVWLLYRVPRGGDIHAVGLLVVALALFSVLALAESATQLHGGPDVPWWLVALYGPPYALVAVAPRREHVQPPQRSSAGPGERWLSARVAMPYVAFVPLLPLWFCSIALGWDSRVFGSGIAVVAVLVVARQLLLLRDHHAVLLERARQALVDELTQVRNRRAFDEDLAQLLDIAQRRDAGLVVLMVDLDELKAINDTHGHLAGDRALVAVAHALSAAARTSDRVYRLGGDEFAMLLPDAAPDGAARVLADARERLSDPAGGAISVSAGMACHPADAREAETLLTIADGRLYRAKRTRIRDAQPDAPAPAAPPRIVVRLPDALPIAEQARS
jgi:diguanylate cyclase (GGDEF)-like protein